MDPDTPNVLPSGELVCVGCGYDLRASQAFGRCPACDRPVADSLAFRRPSVGNVGGDVHCITCGYNLRGLDAAGRCPECGTAVGLSYRGDLLRYANPEWLAKVKLGADLLLLGIVGGIVLGGTAGCLGALPGPSGSIARWAVQPALQFACGLLHVAAVFLLTAQEPRITLTESGLTWRRIVRAAAVVALLTGWASTFASAVGTPLRTALITGAMIIGMIVGLIKTFGEFTYAQALAARVPDAVLVRRTRTVKWGLSVTELLVPILAMTVLLLVRSTALAATGRPVTGTAPAMSSGGAGAGSAGVFPFAPAGPAWRAVALGALGLASGVVGIAHFVFSIWALVLLQRYRRILRMTIALARAGESFPAPGPSASG